MEKLFLLFLMLAPVAFITIICAFIQLDVSLFNPANWGVNVRVAVSIYWTFIAGWYAMNMWWDM